jgi:hypothetical protein
MCHHSKALAAAISFFVTGITLPAAAQRARHHDGFYLRLGGGFTYVSDSVETDEYPLFNDAEGTAKGFGAAGELGIGGSVSPGVVLGGGIFSHWLPSLESENAEVANVDVPDIEFDEGALWVMGFLVDYYPNPSAGLHLQGSAGLALGSLGDGRSNGNLTLDEHSGIGLGLVAGIGHEWWVANNWGLGLLGRFTAAWFTAEDDNDVEWSHFAIAPAILFTATMN